MELLHNLALHLGGIPRPKPLISSFLILSSIDKNLKEVEEEEDMNCSWPGKAAWLLRGPGSPDGLEMGGLYCRCFSGEPSINGYSSKAGIYWMREWLKEKNKLAECPCHGFTFLFKSISFHSSSKGGGRTKKAAVFTFIKWENNTHPSYLQIQMACFFNFILYQWFGSFGCTLESSRSFKNLMPRLCPG